MGESAQARSSVIQFGEKSPPLPVRPRLSFPVSPSCKHTHSQLSFPRTPRFVSQKSKHCNSKLGYSSSSSAGQSVLLLPPPPAPGWEEMPEWNRWTVDIRQGRLGLQHRSAPGGLTTRIFTSRAGAGRTGALFCFYTFQG